MGDLTLLFALVLIVAATCLTFRWYWKLEELWWIANSWWHRLHRTCPCPDIHATVFKGNFPILWTIQCSLLFKVACYISFVNVQGTMIAYSKASGNHKLCQIFQAVLGMFVTSAALMKGELANVHGGWGLSSKRGGLLRLESVWDVTVGKPLTGQDGGGDEKKRERQKRCPLQRLVQVKSHGPNDWRQWTDRVHCCLDPPHPHKSMSLSVWAKVKHCQLGGKNKNCRHKPSIKWSHKWQDRPTVFAAGLR